MKILKYKGGRSFNWLSITYKNYLEIIDFIGGFNGGSAPNAEGLNIGWVGKI